MVFLWFFWFSCNVATSGGPACKNPSCGWLGRASSQVVDGLGLSSLKLTVHYLESCSKFLKTEMKAGEQPSRIAHTSQTYPNLEKPKWEQALSRAKPSAPWNPVQDSENLKKKAGVQPSKTTLRIGTYPSVTALSSVFSRAKPSTPLNFVWNSGNPKWKQGSSSQVQNSV